MNSAEERFRKVEVLMIDYGEEMDEVEKETSNKTREVKEKYLKHLHDLLEEYQEE